jgi:hypothetical protein
METWYHKYNIKNFYILLCNCMNHQNVAMLIILSLSLSLSLSLYKYKDPECHSNQLK